MAPGTATQVALAARSISKHFGGVAALDDVTIEFPEGSVTAVMGDNGAGKSTLMKILSGAIPPDTGQLELFGQRQHFAAPIDARDAGIETVYQDLALSDQRDVAANLFLGREKTRGFGPFRLLAIGEMRRETEDALAQLRVEIPSVRQEVRTLSGGQRQAIAIARAVHQGCRVLIMDEPMAALGLREAEQVQTLIRDLSMKGITQIIVSHNLDHTFAVADRVAVFRQGRVCADLQVSDTSPAEVLHLINGLPGVGTHGRS
jgi:fructose transport system ATP-binding protein